MTDSALLCTGVHVLCLCRGVSLRLLYVPHDPVGQVHAHDRTRRVQGRAVPSWLGACACQSELSRLFPDVCCLLILSFALLFFISHRLLNHSELFSSIRPCLVQGCEGSAGAVRSRSALLLPQTSTQCFSSATCGHLASSQGLSDTEAVGPLRSPGALVSLQDLTADTHMVLITRRE